MQKPKTKKTDAELVRECEEWALHATREEFLARCKPGNMPFPDLEEYERRFGPIPD